MASSSHGNRSRQPLFRPGLLLTHDWSQIHTDHALLATTLEDTDSSTDYQTRVFRITKACQYEAFVSGFLDVGNVSGCPLQFVSHHVHDRGVACTGQPLSAVVKTIFKKTRALEYNKNSPFTDAATEALDEIQSLLGVGNQLDEGTDRVDTFLQQFGSHVQIGEHSYGPCFSWMVLVEEECNMDLLNEVASEIFSWCERHEASVPAAHQGLWYNTQHLIDSTSWHPDKKNILQAVKLRVAQSGSPQEVVAMGAWKTDRGLHQPVSLNALAGLTPVWELLQRSRFPTLASAVREGWERIADRSTCIAPSIPHSLQDIPGLQNYRSKLAEDLGLKQYFPCKLTLQAARSVKKKPMTVNTLQDLPWKVLEQIMLMNSKCREEVINTFIRERRSDRTVKETVPHPMDMMLLLFTCSDFMLRQMLAQKLFTCRLAVPFMVPHADGQVKILMWPLRSIALKYRDAEHVMVEESLAKCNIKKISFVRCGKPKFSKSKMINAFLSAPGHDVFYHRKAFHGKAKRVISDGTVEISHYVPDTSAAPGDHGTPNPSRPCLGNQPALIFNLRGDASDYPVQCDAMIDLSTVLVITVEATDLHKASVRNLMEEASNRQVKVIVILVDSEHHEQSDIKQIRAELADATDSSHVIDACEGDDDMPDVREAIEDVLKLCESMNPGTSLEHFAATKKDTVDEFTNEDCCNGKQQAEAVLSEMPALGGKAKQALLPHQNDRLHEIGALLRLLNRECGKDDVAHEKENIKQKMKDIRAKQAQQASGNTFVEKTIQLFEGQEKTRAFAIRWLQLELDNISRATLQPLEQAKLEKLNDLSKAHSKENSANRVESLTTEINELDRQIADATCGIEHLLRELAHMYEAAHELGRMEPKVSSLPDIVGKLLIEGQPVELMDGDHGLVPIAWIKAVFKSLAQMVDQNKKICVLSILGIQSSGKSTLLNTMFGLEFAVSAGRCTRGIYAQLLPVESGSDLPFDYLMVLDSEGLRAQVLGSQNREHDNELSTLVIGFADLTLINIKGESSTEIADVLQIVIQAFLRMKLADSSHKRRCIFIHQNVTAPDAHEKLASDRKTFHAQLDDITRQACDTQGLSAMPSFRNVITFDEQKDVVYVPDLWSGETINQKYSLKAAEICRRVQQKMQEELDGHSTQHVVQKVDDMWNGVLADDFVFSFRNTYAVKAYIELEREYSRLTRTVELELIDWLNTDVRSTIRKCHTQADLEGCESEAKSLLSEKLESLLSQNQLDLHTFIETHNAREVMYQWKETKEMSFTMFGVGLKDRADQKLKNMVSRRFFELFKAGDNQVDKAKLMQQIKERGEQLQRRELKDNLDSEAKEEFGHIWDQAYKGEYTINLCIPQYTKKFLKDSGIFGSDTGKFVEDELKRNSSKSVGSLQIFTEEDISEDHVAVRQCLKGKACPRVDAAQIANAMMKTVMEKIVNISQQDAEFEQRFKVQALNFTIDEIDQHNNTEKAKFVFTLQFRVMFVVRVALCAAPHFERMQARFKERHGATRGIKAYKDRAFRLFKDAVQNIPPHKSLAREFCEAIKTDVVEHIQRELGKKIRQELGETVGDTKYDLIVALFTEIARRRDFEMLMQYVHEPVECAAKWLQQHGNDMFFTTANECSKYSAIASELLADVMGNITSSTEATASSLSSAQLPYKTWLAEFRKHVTGSVPLTRLDEVLCQDTGNLADFQQNLKSGLAELHEELKHDFEQVTADTAVWQDVISPFKQVFDRLWGCKDICPFCREPCMYTDPAHAPQHQCVQNRPLGIAGVRNIHTQVSVLDTCNCKVSSSATFSCQVSSLQCRMNSDCCGVNHEEVYHPYRDYKDYTSGWDIQPDPTCTAAKFWMWAVVTFESELLQHYQGTKLEIPASWRDISEADAMESLREHNI